MALDQDQVLGMGDRSLVQLLQEVYIAAGTDDDELDAALALALDRPAALRDLVQLIWRRVELLNECDRQRGLRSKVGRIAAGGVFNAMTESLVRLIASRVEASALIAIYDNHLWIADLVFPYLLFPMEMNRWGIGPGWDSDGDVSGLVQEPIGPSATFLKWASWCSAGEVRRGTIASARYLGGYPARGLPIAAPRVAPLVRALRENPPPHPVIVLTTPTLLGFYLHPSVPMVSDFVRQTRSADERAGGTFGFFPLAIHRAMAADPLAAIASVLARGVDPSPLLSLVLVLRTACAYALCRSQLRDDGVWQASTGSAGRHLFPLLALRCGKHLVVHGDSLIAICTSLGLAPFRCVMSNGQVESWDWGTMLACAWSDLEGDGLLQRIQVSGLDGIWLRFPAGGMPRELVDSGRTCHPSNEDLPARDMNLNVAWYPPVE